MFAIAQNELRPALTASFQHRGSKLPLFRATANRLAVHDRNCEIAAVPEETAVQIILRNRSTSFVQAARRQRRSNPPSRPARKAGRFSRGKYTFFSRLIERILHDLRPLSPKTKIFFTGPPRSSFARLKEAIRHRGQKHGSDKAPQLRCSFNDGYLELSPPFRFSGSFLRRVVSKRGARTWAYRLQLPLFYDAVRSCDTRR